MATTFLTLSRQDWPHESGGLDAFYGDPRGANGGADPQWEAANLTTVTPPWSMTSGGAHVSAIRVHRKCAESLSRVLSAIWDLYGRNQDAINAAHLNEFDGSYNFRVNVNAPSKLSVHAYGAALDLAASENPNGKSWTDDGRMLPRPVIDAFLAEGWCWGGDFNATKDPMHFQATFNAHADAPPAPTPGVVAVAPDPAPVTPTPPPAVPVVLTPSAQPLDQLSRMRAFLLNESGIVAEVETFKADLVARVTAFSLRVGASSTQPVAQVPAAPGVALPAAVAPAAPPPPVRRFLNITATVFGGPGDEQPLAYPDVKAGWADRPGVALPFHFVGARPRVRCFANGKTVDCDVVDVGPWFPSHRGPADPYWTTSTRPRAETDGSTNGAGIDLTPAAASALGIDGKGKVDWEFVTVATLASVPIKSPLKSKIVLTNAGALAASGAVAAAIPAGVPVNKAAVAIAVIQVVSQVATIIMRAWFTNSVTPQSVK